MERPLSPPPTPEEVGADLRLLPMTSAAPSAAEVPVALETDCWPVAEALLLPVALDAHLAGLMAHFQPRAFLGRSVSPGDKEEDSSLSLLI